MVAAAAGIKGRLARQEATRQHVHGRSAMDAMRCEPHRDALTEKIRGVRAWKNQKHADLQAGLLPLPGARGERKGDGQGEIR